jgi:hypothetical protein
MQTRSIAIHPVEVLIYMSGLCKAATAIRTSISKALTNEALVFLPINSKSPILGN